MSIKLLSTSALAVLFAATALAQDETGSLARYAPIMQALPDVSQNEQAPVTEFVTGQSSGELVASDLIDRAVYDTSDREIGKIVDLAIDENQRLYAVVVETDQSEGDKRIAFSIDALGYRASDEDVRLVVAIGRDGLEEAPSFTSLGEAAALNDLQSGAPAGDEARPPDLTPPSNQ